MPRTTQARAFGAFTGRRYGSFAGRAAVLSGQLNATLGPLTLSGTGRVAIAGALGITLGNLTLAGTGRLAITGALSKTLGPLTLNAAGTSATSGSGAAAADVWAYELSPGVSAQQYVLEIHAMLSALTPAAIAEEVLHGTLV